MEGLTGKESCAFKRKEASLLPLVRKDLWEGYLPTISNRLGRIALHLGRDCERHVSRERVPLLQQYMENNFFCITFLFHYVGNVLLFKLNIFAEDKCGKNLSHQHKLVFKI